MTLPDYPKTIPLAGSGGAGGAARADGLDPRALAGRPLVVEEKLDGQHVGISFDDDGQLLLFSRHHRVYDPTTGACEPSFRPLLADCLLHLDALFDALCGGGRRLTLYGEWLRAHHTVAYDALPAWFLEDDCFDAPTGTFLDTPARDALRPSLPPPLRAAAPVLHAGPLDDAALARLPAPWLAPSRFQTPAWEARLLHASARAGLREEARVAVCAAAAAAGPSEGLYLKVEEGGAVVGRYKWVRPSFVGAVCASAHWQRRPLIERKIERKIELEIQRGFAP